MKSLGKNVNFVIIFGVYGKFEGRKYILHLYYRGKNGQIAWFLLSTVRFFDRIES